MKTLLCLLLSVSLGLPLLSEAQTTTKTTKPSKPAPAAPKTVAQS